MHLPRVIASAAIVDKGELIALDDVFDTNEADTFTPFAGRVVRHSPNLFLVRFEEGRGSEPILPMRQGYVKLVCE
jgi:hypothetical protein